ncbi:hypothetical protein H6P1_00874 (plasmid) [Variovorax sp. PBL-H6]|nr:hypothetical protein SRS16P1_00060 [Variovorax sp. SRS16]VTU41685.1 hypothetical protein E5P1_00060 [Variovorax sp. PBL-E5]VTU44729.1 hypothetical protein H6P1_00874 [Variovorax sp. PBL-H6]
MVSHTEDNHLRKIYTGIGSRETPSEVLQLMEELGVAFAKAGWTLRSGGADGADDAFEQGCFAVDGAMTIFLPWKGFNGRTSPHYGGDDSDAMHLASTVHPAWDTLGQGPKKMHSRNAYQVLGRELDEPTDLVICWTRDGCESRKTRNRGTGGTATAIVIASDRGIPVFNLRNDDSRHRLNVWLHSAGIDYQVPTEFKRPSPVQVGLF